MMSYIENGMKSHFSSKNFFFKQILDFVVHFFIDNRSNYAFSLRLYSVLYICIGCATAN